MTKNIDPALPTQLQQYVHLSRYARWLDEEQRRDGLNVQIRRVRVSVAVGSIRRDQPLNLHLAAIVHGEGTDAIE